MADARFDTQTSDDGVVHERGQTRILADAALLDAIARDHSLEQLGNVTSLPGIVGHVIGMPDMHEGYGFPVGGVAATGNP